MNDNSNFHFFNHGSVWLCEPVDDKAREHLEAHIAADALWFGDALVVEPRYVNDLATALANDGFGVR